MKKSAKLLSAIVSGMLLLSACGQGVGQLQNGSSQFAASQSIPNSKVKINNNSQSLESRIIRKNQSVGLKRDGFSTAAEGDIGLTLVAEVLPPVVDGKTIQATNVFVAPDGVTAYVSYDVAGDEYAGGVYIIDITDNHHPVIKAEMTLDGTDFYSVAVKGDRLYLPGATEDEGYASPAILQTMQLGTGGHSFAADKGRINVPSYAATDVSAHMNHVFVSSGDVGGGITRIDANTLTKTGFYPMEDARSVNMDYYNAETDEGWLTAFRGQPGEVQLLGPDLTMKKKISLTGAASIPVSQSILDVSENIAIVGAGNGGTMAIDLTAGTLLDTMVPEHGITNGASFGSVPKIGPLVFTAEGEDGVGVAKLVNGQLERMGSLDFSGPYSSNMVKNDCCMVFVANGYGGLSLLAVEGCSVGNNPSPSPTPSPEPTPTPTPVPSATPTPMPSISPSPSASPTDCIVDIDTNWEQIKASISISVKGNVVVDWEELRAIIKLRLKGKTRIDWRDLVDCVEGELQIDWDLLRERLRELICASGCDGNNHQHEHGQGHGSDSNGNGHACDDGEADPPGQSKP